MTPSRPVSAPLGTQFAFSLIELLSVMAVIALLTAMAVPVFSSRSQDVTRAAGEMSDVLQQARTRAMSKNTYVYVGLAGTSGARPELAIGVIEASDGLVSRSNDLASGGAPLQSIRRATFLRGVELDTATARTSLASDQVPTAGQSQIEDLETSQIRFPADLVTRRDTVASSEFAWVIQFGPDGAARLDATRRTVPDYIFLGLVPVDGDPANAVGLVVDGTCGAVRVVRPEA